MISAAYQTCPNKLENQDTKEISINLTFSSLALLAGHLASKQG
jgi:hypothetical protein